MLTVLLAACLSRAPGSAPADPLDGPPPSIAQVAWACDVEASRWEFSVATEAWTGGGLLWLARGDVYEEHRIRSVEASADGAEDTLALELSIVADWRDASGGTSTRWRCVDEPGLSFQVTVFDVTGEEASDCRAWGADPDVWDGFAEVEACPTVLEITDTGLGER